MSLNHIIESWRDEEYRESLARLDSQSRTFVNERMLPSQIRTHEALSNLKRAMG